MGALELVLAQVAGAQTPYGLGRWQGKATFYLDWEKQDDKRSQTKYETILFQERLGLRNVGAFIVDPRLLTLNLGGSFGLSQEDAIAVTDNSLRVGNGHLYDYAFEGLLLSGQPYPVTFFANRDQSILTQGFGGQSNSSFESRGGILELREGNFLKDYGFLNFSSLLDVHQEFINEDSSVFGTPFRRDESRNIVRYQAKKGGETSDLYLRYELNDVNDPLNVTNVFTSNTLRAGHSIDFGPTLNRRLDSALYYFTRSGSSPGSYLSIDEGLHLDHHVDFATDYRYNFSQSDSDAGSITTNAASAGLLHRLYQQLTTTLNARGLRQDFSTGEKTVLGGQGGLAYRRKLPWNGELTTDASIGYQVDDNNFTSSQIEVVDEPHVAPPVLGAGAGFTLDNPFVENDTIVMVDVRGGSRFSTTLNVDYSLSQEGSLTKIIPLPGSAVIQPGDPLEVSYTYDIDPSLKYGTTNVGTRVAADFQWVAASYEHLLSDQNRLAGTASPQFLINQNLDRLRGDLRHRWGNVRAQSSVAYDILSSTIVDSNTLRFGQLLSYQPSLPVMAQLSGDQYFVDYPGETRRSESYLVRGTLNYLTPFGLSIATVAGYRSYHDTDVPSDEIVDFGVRMHWSYHSLEVSPSFTWTDYRSRSNDIRGQLRITRHLF